MSTERTAKQRDFYGTGGWCNDRLLCLHDGTRCVVCFQKNQFEHIKKEKPHAHKTR